MPQLAPMEELQAAVADALRCDLPADVAARLERAVRYLADPAGDWIRHTEAAGMLRRQPDALAKTDRTGRYEIFPHLTRIRPKGSKFIYMLRSEVVAHIAALTRGAVAKRSVPVSEIESIEARYGRRFARQVASL